MTMSHLSAPTATLKNRDKELVPRVLLLAVAGLVLSVMALVAYATITHRPLDASPADGPVAKELSVRLLGYNDGSVEVWDTNGKLIRQLSPAEGGFVAGVARALAHERGKSKIDPAEPVRIVQFEDGRVAVFDDTTRQRVEILGFGRDNLAAFKRLLATKEEE